MFLYFLGADEKLAFLQLAHGLMLADGREAAEETQTLDLLCREMGVDRESGLQDAQSIDESSALACFSNPSNQSAVLLELLLLSHSDGDSHESEQEMIDRVAKAFGLSVHLEPMRNWALRQVALIQEASGLLANIAA